METWTEGFIMFFFIFPLLYDGDLCFVLIFNCFLLHIHKYTVSLESWNNSNLASWILSMRNIHGDLNWRGLLMFFFLLSVTFHPLSPFTCVQSIRWQRLVKERKTQSLNKNRCSSVEILSSLFLSKRDSAIIVQVNGYVDILA